MLDEKELEKRFMEFLNKYYQGYSDLSYDEEYMWLEETIPSYLSTYYKAAYREPMIGDNVFFQIFSGIDALDPSINPFYQMMSRIEKEYGLDRDIIEVGCGYFPALSYEITKRKKELGIEKGRIIAYDDKLVTTSLEGTTLVKDKFLSSTIIASPDALIIGRRPCKATEALIKASSINNLEFYLQLCPCTDHVPIEFKLSHKEIKGHKLSEMYAEQLARETLPSGFIIEKETIIERVGNSPKQIAEETIIKTKKIR